MVQRVVAFVVVLSAVLFAPAVASAACSGAVTATSWTGGGATDSWTDGANWSAGTQPGACSDVTITRPDVNALDITNVPGFSYEIHALDVGPGVRLHGGSLLVATTLDWETDPNDFPNGVGYGLTVTGHTTWHGGGQTFLDSGTTSTTVSLTGGATFSGGTNYIETGTNGMLSMDGTVTVAGSGLDVEANGSGLVFLPDNLSLTTGDLAEPGHALVEHAVSVVGSTVTLAQGAELAFDSTSISANDGTTFTGPGVVSVAGTSSQLDLPSPLNLAAGAALRLEQGVMSDGSLGGTGAFQWRGGHVAGDVSLGGGITTTLSTTGQKLLDSDAALTNAGTFDLAGDTLLSTGGTPSFTNAGTLTGGGAIQAPYTQTAAGTLDIAVGSGGADRLDIAGSAALNGKLRVRTEQGFMPSGTYTIATYTSRSGSFSSLQGVSPGYTLSSTATETTLTATGVDPNSGSNPDPDPNPNPDPGPGTGQDSPTTVQANPGFVPIAQSQGFSGSICGGETTVTVGDSIVRGCFVSKPGNVLEAQGEIEVDGLVLTMPASAGDRFIIDRDAKVIRRGKADTPVNVAVRKASCGGTPQILGRIAALAAGVPHTIYRLNDAVKASIVGQEVLPLFGGLFRVTQGVVQRWSNGVLGGVMIAGQAKLRYFADVAFNAQLAVSSKLRCLVSGVSSKMAAGFAKLMGLPFASIDLHLEGDHLAGQADLRFGGLFSAQGSFELGVDYITGQYDVTGKAFTAPTGLVMDHMSGQLQLLNATKLRLLADFAISGKFGARNQGMSGRGELRAENGGWALEVPSATLTLPALGSLNGNFTFRDTGFFDIGVAARLKAPGPNGPQFDGSLAGWYAPAAQRFSYEGNGAITNFGIGASGAVSSTGYAACGQVPVYVLGKQVGVVSSGLGYKWGDLLPTIFLAGCDFGPYTAVKPSARAAQAASRGFTLPKGLPAAALRVTGPGAVPRFTLSGPDGKALTFKQDGPVGDGVARLVETPEDNSAYVLIGRPAAGRWTVTPTDGAISSLDIGRGLPAPVAKAKVRRRGGGWELRWSLTPRAGQRVTLVENGGGVHAPIVTTAKARGVKRFMPAYGAAGVRRITAVVEQDGMPRATLVAGSYRAPKALGPPAPKALRLRRTGTSLRVSWRRQAAVDHYAVTVAIRGRPRAQYDVRTPGLRIVAVGPRDRGRVSVRAVSARTLREGRPVAARLRARR
jgi:hypothetical protein